MGHPSETHLKLKYHEISFADNLFGSCPIVLQFCTEHGSDTVVLSAKFRSSDGYPIGERQEAQILKFNAPPLHT